MAARILPEWYDKAIEIMVANGCSLKEAIIIGELVVSSEDIVRATRHPAFKRLWHQAWLRHFAEVASHPDFKKETVVGKLIDLARKLEEEGEHDKSAEVLFKAAKAMGWIGPESQVSVFGELSQKDLDSIRKTLSKEVQAAKVN